MPGSGEPSSPPRRTARASDDTGVPLSPNAPGRLLVVDPSPLIRRTVRRVARDIGLSVREADSVVDGLGAVVRERPSALAISRGSCELPADALIAAIRATPHLAATPIAVLANADGRPGRTPGGPTAPLVPGSDALIHKDERLDAALRRFLEPLGLVADGTEGPRLSGHILLVEDAELIQRLLSRVLHAAGATVVVARDGIEAIVAAARDRFDLVLMDIELPRLDGPGALRAIREAGIRTPVVAATAHGHAYADRALQLGFADVIDKRRSPREIVDACSRWL